MSEAAPAVVPDQPTDAANAPPPNQEATAAATPDDEQPMIETKCSHQPKDAAAPQQPGGSAPTQQDAAQAAAAAADSTRRVQEGDTVILDVNGDRFSFCHMKKGGTVKVGKISVSHDTFIGQPYGAVFDLADDSRTLKRCFRDGAETWASAKDTQRNNAELFDLGVANQNLSSEEIAALRAEGKSGAEIMAALEAGSSTFATKTEFSQEKYRKKKAKKYLTFVTVVRPTARSIAEVYFAKTPQKICSLRVDSLAVMLSLANIGSGARVLVLDATSGLVTAATLERLGGSGSVIATYAGARPTSLDIVRSINLSTAGKAPLSLATLASLDAAFGIATAATGQPQAASAAAATLSAVPAAAAAAAAAAVANLASAAARDSAACNPAAAATNAASAATATAQGADSSVAAQQHVQGGSVDAADGAEPMQTDVGGAAEQPADSSAASAAAVPADQQSGPPVADGTGHPAKPGGAESAAVGGVANGVSTAEKPGDHRAKSSSGIPFATSEQLAAHAAAGGFDCCVVAAPQLLPAAVLARLLPLLAPSAPFVVWHPHMQPLAEAMSQLQSTKHALALQLQESWWREIQVLPARTHPTMSMSGTGGYLLSGIKVVPQPADASRPNKKGRTS